MALIAKLTKKPGSPLESPVAYCMERYLDYLNFERGLSPRTLEAYQRDVGQFVDFAVRRGRDSPDSVDSGDVREYVLHLSERGLASTSVRRAQSSLRTYFGFLIEEGLLEEDPTEGLRSPKVGRTLPTVLSPAEMETLLEAPRLDSPAYWRDRTILEVLYATGIRVSELIGLRITDLELDTRVCTVFGKGAKERMVPLGRPACLALERYLREVRPGLDRGRGQGRVFLSHRGRPLPRTTVWTLVRSAALAAGIRATVSPHTLRHTFATHLLEGGADLVAVQELLGHADVTTTQIYTHVDRRYLRDVHQKYPPRS